MKPRQGSRISETCRKFALDLFALEKRILIDLGKYYETEPIH